MEFLDEETGPRFFFQSRSNPPPSHLVPQSLALHFPSILISLTLSIPLFLLPLFFFQSEPFQSIFLWFALSLLLGPFAPSSITGGDICVGVGKLLDPPPPNTDLDRDDPKKRTPNRRSRARRPEETGFSTAPETAENLKKSGNSGDSSQFEDNFLDDSVIEGGEREWDEGDFALLKKLLVKHPVGKLKRWEVIAKAFLGRHGVESVIKMTKSMGDKKMSDADSFARFLKDRKPLDKRIGEDSEDGGGGAVVESGEVMRENVSWSGGDDVALLNALKVFTKNVPMRWEKIAAAVPGKSKAACMKRVAELKKGFRSSKASTDA